ncbi:MAG: RNA polymerase sigma-70 factor [Nocardioides sp.]
MTSGSIDASAPGTDVFVEHRSLLFTVAYEMLGSAADAEDVLQETWLRWHDVALAEVRDPRAYLVRITTRLALNRLRTQQRRRESYLGPWLPEPLLTSPDIVEDVELADSVSMAMLLVLDTLSPTERAVFVLREVFGFGYDEIAAAVDKSDAAVRQVASRARKHVEARRPRTSDDVDRDAVIRRFMDAAIGGDLQALMDVLAPDVVLISDGGGKVSAARRPIEGRDKVAQFLRGLATLGQTMGVVSIEPAWVNGGPGFHLLLDGERVTTGAARIQDGTIAELYFVRNPDKLGRLDEPVLLTRGR